MKIFILCVQASLILFCMLLNPAFFVAPDLMRCYPKGICRYDP